ncbi:N,N-dimethylformamidase beta subunit family domain-containing protein [Microtetraspora glauca]|uniref:N,N-dimethylformamidase beta subunit family domain-containing protein n=1 Tax=Microtetraspora glauca TaxID=1996 RepID=A0ABV3GPH9_MICGL
MTRSRIGIRGYTDTPSVAPGETVSFHLSADRAGQADVRLVRLQHGDPDPSGPGIRITPVPAEVDGVVDVAPRFTQHGSFVTVDDSRGALAGAQGLTVHCFLWPTTPAKEHQGIIGRWSEAERSGWALTIEDGRPTFTVGDGETTVSVTGAPVFPEVWYSVTARFDPATRQVTLHQRSVVNSVNSRLSTIVDLDTDADAAATCTVSPAAPAVPLVMAGLSAGAPTPERVVGAYNGKIDSPAVWDRPLDDADVARLATGEDMSVPASARWDFAAGITKAGIADDVARDISGNGLDGRLVNQPDQAMTGWNWTGEEEHFVHAPEQYGALWFHEDSLADCAWPVTTTWTVPEGMRSGAYALEVTTEDGNEDHVTFFVIPPRGTAENKILLLVPTFSYLAYANSQVMQNAVIGQSVMGVLTTLDDLDLELHESRYGYGLSTYDYHADGRGVQYSSWRRPILNMRPKYRHEFGSVWQFPADLHLIDWLESNDFGYDIATDHELAAEGHALLARYNVVITGTHPEYYSGRMLDAWEAYLAGGGRGMYLAGNGFYWTATQHPAKPWLIEVRKGETGDQAWRGRPGELFHSTTGVRGGLWRMKGRAPQKLFGTGYGAHGLDRSTGYLQLPDARDKRASFVMEGIDPDEIIGHFGLVNNGASGLEMDRIDYALGTPPNVLLLASSRGHSANAMMVPEEQYFSHAGMNGREDPLVRADIVVFTTKNGGAQFSTSSMAWCGSLSHNGYDNNVSRMTANVLRRFAQDGPIEPID